MTDTWMLLVPRSREYCSGISVNGLGYVGSLFVPDREGLDAIRRLGAMKLLTEESVSDDSPPGGG